MSKKKKDLIQKKKRYFIIKSILQIILTAIIIIGFCVSCWLYFWYKTNNDILHFVAGWVPVISIIVTLIGSVSGSFIMKEKERIRKQIRILGK